MKGSEGSLEGKDVKDENSLPEEAAVISKDSSNEKLSEVLPESIVEQVKEAEVISKDSSNEKLSEVLPENIAEQVKEAAETVIEKPDESLPENIAEQVKEAAAETVTKDKNPFEQ